ncbi:MAG: DNA polymerase III subunit delta' [Candidatus Tectimicrobiota bacterium]
MALRDIRGQEQAVLLLQKALSSARLAHAYLFYGPQGIGKKLTALQFAKALACAQGTTDACERCPSCRKVTAGNHPDLIYVGPEGNAIRIEHIRTIQRQLGYKPYESPRTIIILDGCELFTPPAANAVLKTLEEPPETALLLLVTSKKEALPLTIVSRCQQIAFRRLPTAHVQALLEHQGVDRQTAMLAATLTDGSLSLGNQADIAQMLGNRQQVYTLLQEQTRPPTTPLFLQARPLAGTREQCDEILRWLMLFCRDLVMLKISPTLTLYNQDLQAELLSLAQRLSTQDLLRLFTSLEQLRGYLAMNANTQLTLEQALVQFRQVMEANRAPINHAV